MQTFSHLPEIPSASTEDQYPAVPSADSSETMTYKWNGAIILFKNWNWKSTFIKLAHHTILTTSKGMRFCPQGSVHILYGRLVKAGRSDHGHICVRLQTHPHRPHSQTCLQMDAGHSRDAFAHVSVNARRHICIHTSLLRIWWFPTQPGERWQGRGEQLAVTSAYRTSSGSMQQLKLDLCTPSSDKQKLQLNTSECC